MSTGGWEPYGIWPSFWSNVRPLAVVTFLLVFYFWLLSWWIARPAAVRGRTLFRYWWPTTMTALLYVAGLTLKGIGGSFAGIMFSIAVFLNAPALLPALLLDEWSSYAPPAWVQLLILTLFLWGAWYGLICYMERRQKLKTTPTIFDTKTGQGN